MTGIPEFNAPEFMTTAKHLENEGFEVFNPASHDMDAGFNPFGCSGNESKDELAEMGFSLRGALAADLDWIARNAQYVAVMDGYETSKGVAAEIALADALGIPVVDPWSLMFDAKYGDVEYVLKREPASYYEPKTDETLPLWERANLNKLPSATPTADALRNARDVSHVDLKATEAARDTGLIGPTEFVFSKEYVTEAGLKNLKTMAENLGKIGTLDGKSSWDFRIAEVADPTAPTMKEMDGGAKLTVSATGGQKGSKEARYDLIPVKPLEYLARLYGKGAEKYDDNNWAKGYDWKYSYAAMQRHANQFWGGEDNDPEMDLPHLASVAWHAFTMMYFMENHPQFDSRLKEVPKS